MTHSGKTSKPSIVFIGAGPVASASLELLVESFAVEAVITKPRPPKHRGNVPVLELAEKLQLPLVLVSSKKELSQKVAETTFKSNVAVLIDFGIIVAQDVIDAFPLGIINSHFSLLPEWRGADPITFALLSGQERTGVSLMKLVQAMDEGPILCLGVQENITSLTTPELTDRLVHLSYALLRDQLPNYIETEAPIRMEQLSLHRQIPDYPSEASYSRKLTKDDGILDFSKPAIELEREVRAYAEWPKSRTVIAGKDVVITKAHVANGDELPEAKHANGDVFVHEKRLYIQTSDGVLGIDSLKPAGKGDMPAQAFLAGYGREL